MRTIIIFHANKFLIVRNDAAITFQMRTFSCCLKFDSVRKAFICICEWCAHQIGILSNTRKTIWICSFFFQLSIVIRICVHERYFMWTFDTLFFNVHNSISSWKHTVPFPLSCFFITLKVQNHVKHSMQCRPFRRKCICVCIRCTYVVVCFMFTTRKKDVKFYVVAAHANVHFHIHGWAKDDFLYSQLF